MSLRTLRGGLLALLLPMTACVSGPDYHLPANAAAASTRAAQPFVSGKEASFSHDAPPDRWWQLYGDPSLTATCAKHWRPTPTCAPLMPIFGAPALPCWSTARAVPCRPTWMHRARSPVPVATPGVGRAAVLCAGPSPLLSTGSCRRHPPRHRSRQRRRGGCRCGTRPGPRGRRCCCHPCLSPDLHKQSHARCDPAGAGDTARHAGGNPSPGRGRARNDFDVSRAGRRSTAARRRCRTCWRSARPHCSNWPR